MVVWAGSRGFQLTDDPVEERREYKPVPPRFPAFALWRIRARRWLRRKVRR
jgi:hypothetical protein